MGGLRLGPDTHLEALGLCISWNIANLTGVGTRCTAADRLVKCFRTTILSGLKAAFPMTITILTPSCGVVPLRASRKALGLLRRDNHFGVMGVFS
jgi:hypothetical protein